MFRLSVFAVVVICLSGVRVRAAEPSALLIAASHQRAASSLPPLPHGTLVVVLVQDGGDDYATINARAMAARRATHFVFDCEDQSLLAQMFRERLTRLGAIPVELRTSRSQFFGPANSNTDAPTQTTFSNLLARPQR